MRFNNISQIILSNLTVHNVGLVGRYRILYEFVHATLWIETFAAEFCSNTTGLFFAVAFQAHTCVVLCI